MASYFDGYEQFRSTDTSNPGTFMRLAGYTVRGAISAGLGRLPASIGLYTLNSAYERDWTWGGDTLTIGFACKQQARGALFGLKVGDATGRDVPHVVVYTDPVSALVTIQTGPDQSEVGYVTPIPTRWYYYEVVMNRATKVIEVFVNGKSDVAYTLPDVIAASAVVRMVFNPFDMLPSFPADANYKEDTKVFDDMYAQDGGRLGAIQISGRLPDGDRDTEWGVAGPNPTAAHNQMVGRLPPDMANMYIYTGTNDRHDSFVSSAKLPDNGAILAQGLIALVRKATADPVSIIANIDSHTVTLSNIGRNWEYRYAQFTTSGYDRAAIEAAEFGVRSVI
ncbi:hypothetical protein CVQ90_20410 [Salmonella enterica subsp. enterica serovar Bareilly]|nr:hypothetical protein [Salmonella enterica subsp. enterica serovar Bareilly]